jgi:hypothetical protein
MKTTLEIDDEIFRRVKAKAALEGIRLRDFVNQALRMRLTQGPPSQERTRRLRFPLIECGPPGTLQIPEDIAHRTETAEDQERYEESL